MDDSSFFDRMVSSCFGCRGDPMISGNSSSNAVAKHEIKRSMSTPVDLSSEIPNFDSCINHYDLHELGDWPLTISGSTICTAKDLMPIVSSSSVIKSLESETKFTSTRTFANIHTSNVVTQQDMDCSETMPVRKAYISVVIPRRSEFQQVPSFRQNKRLRKANLSVRPKSRFVVNPTLNQYWAMNSMQVLENHLSDDDQQESCKKGKKRQRNRKIAKDSPEYKAAREKNNNAVRRTRERQKRENESLKEENAYMKTCIFEMHSYIDDLKLLLIENGIGFEDRC